MKNILVAPFMVQAGLAEDVSVETVPGSQIDAYGAVDDKRIAEEARAVADIRLSRDNRGRVLGISSEGFDDSDLNPSRVVCWQLARQLCRAELNQKNGEDYSSDLYLLRSQTQYDEATHGQVDIVDVNGVQVRVRSEEGLLDVANEVIDRVSHAARKGTSPGLSSCDQDTDCVVRENSSGNSSHIPLRGYEFNPGDLGGQPRKRFDRYPSCVVFLAAAALEQVTMSDHVIRLCHYELRNRDSAAKTLVTAMGRELPIETIALGDNGKVNKMFSWHTSAPERKFARGIVRAASNHVGLS